MISLYHWEPNAGSLALMICLREKGIAFDSHYVDMLKLEQHEAAYLSVSSKGELPMLLVDDQPMSDTGLALQFLAERHPQPRLAPADAASWYDVQAWTARLDGKYGLAENVQLVGWNKVMLSAVDPAELERFRQRLAKIPKPRQSGWNAVWSDAEADEDQLILAEERIAAIVDRIEKALSGSDWIVGDEFSIIDILAFAHAHTLPSLLPDVCNPSASPALCAWVERIGRRQSVIDALAAGQRDFSPASFSAPGS